MSQCGPLTRFFAGGTVSLAANSIHQITRFTSYFGVGDHAREVTASRSGRQGN